MCSPKDHEDASSDASDLRLAHDHLHLAAELINGVMERRRLQSTMQEISLLSGAKADADNADRVLVGDGDPKRAADLTAHADREVGMAERYMRWRNDEPAAS